MKNFFKNVLSTIVGVLLSTVILSVISFFIMIGILGALAGSGTPTFTPKENTILTINLSGVMKDRVVENPFLEYVGYDQAKEMALTDILSAIKKAKENKNIVGIYINSGYFSVSTASLNELRDQLKDFKSSGKFIIAYADSTKVYLTRLEFRYRFSKSAHINQQ